MASPQEDVNGIYKGLNWNSQGICLWVLSCELEFLYRLIQAAFLVIPSHHTMWIVWRILINENCQKLWPRLTPWGAQSGHYDTAKLGTQHRPSGRPQETKKLESVLTLSFLWHFSGVIGWGNFLPGIKGTAGLAWMLLGIKVPWQGKVANCFSSMFIGYVSCLLLRPLLNNNQQLKVIFSHGHIHQILL